MSIESGKLTQERKEREISDTERKEKIARDLEYSKEKKALLERIAKDKKMACLRSLVERGLIPLETVERVADGHTLDTGEVQEIFDRIDEIEEIQNIDALLPGHLRITKEDYLSAVEDHTVRSAILSKIDDALGYLYRSSHDSFAGIMQFFSSLIRSIPTKKQKDVMIVQGNMIDIKRDLKKR